MISLEQIEANTQQLEENNRKLLEIQRGIRRLIWRQRLYAMVIGLIAGWIMGGWLFR